MMPAASGLFDGLDRNRRANAASERKQDLPELELVEMKIRHGPRDTAYAVGKMCERGVSSIVVLGGDGTNRVVARHCDPNIPLCTLSTGTNNTFPKMQEATVAGLATGWSRPGESETKRCAGRRSCTSPSTASPTATAPSWKWP